MVDDGAKAPDSIDDLLRLPAVARSHQLPTTRFFKIVWFVTFAVTAAAGALFDWRTLISGMITAFLVTNLDWGARLFILDKRDDKADRDDKALPS